MRSIFISCSDGFISSPSTFVYDQLRLHEYGFLTLVVKLEDLKYIYKVTNYLLQYINVLVAVAVAAKSIFLRTILNNS